MLVHSRKFYLADAKIGPSLFIPQLPSSSLDINLGVVHKLHNHFREPPHPIILYSLYNICVYNIVIIWANPFPLAFVDFDIDKVTYWCTMYFHLCMSSKMCKKLCRRKKEKGEGGESSLEWSLGDSCSSFTLGAKLAAMENWITGSFLPPNFVTFTARQMFFIFISYPNIIVINTAKEITDGKAGSARCVMYDAITQHTSDRHRASRSRHNNVVASFS